MSLGLNVATIARIEADRIYALILPDPEAEGTVTVPLPFLTNVLETGRNLEPLAPNYIKTGLETLGETAKIRRLRKKAVIPKQSLARVAAAFRIAADLVEGRYP